MRNFFGELLVSIRGLFTLFLVLVQFLAQDLDYVTCEVLYFMIQKYENIRIYFENIELTYFSAILYYLPKSCPAQGRYRTNNLSWYCLNLYPHIWSKTIGKVYQKANGNNLPYNIAQLKLFRNVKWSEVKVIKKRLNIIQSLQNITIKKQ